MGEKEEEEEGRHDVFYKSGVKEEKKHNAKNGNFKATEHSTIRDSEDLASEWIAPVCSIKLITEGSICITKIDKTVLLAVSPVCKPPPLNSFLLGPAEHPQIRCMAVVALKL